ncbi:MAG: flagellin lysine-N-methylase [Clostridia bacterium]|nr:flagellin lysine-N-methylase [Clostridia bacterium]
MKLYAPKYYGDFKCIADKCEHNCCTGWEIDIDDQTLKKYKRLNGGYGDAVKDSISTNGTPHFILGDKDRCPHLNENGLCKIITCLGEEYLCDICKNHPRFFNYTKVAEVGIGMSCPEAARVILSSPNYLVFYEIGDIDAEAESTDFDGVSERGRVYEILLDDSLSIEERLENIQKKYSISIEDDEYWLELLETLEYLDYKHKKLFMNYTSSHRPDIDKAYLERFLAYLIYRHCTEALDIADFALRLKFCLFCEHLFASLIYTQKAHTLGEVARLASIISEEIEYSEDNTFSLMY